MKTTKKILVAIDIETDHTNHDIIHGLVSLGVYQTLDRCEIAKPKDIRISFKNPDQWKKQTRSQ